MDTKLSLGDRMKDYENRTGSYLLPRTPFVIRVDGCNFKRYTANLARPYDDDLIYDMNQTAMIVASKIQGCKLAFVQSDEISFIVYQPSHKEELYYDYKVQKIVSVVSSLTSTTFNNLRSTIGEDTSAVFDARCFSLPTIDECINYLIWRQRDGKRNSISAAAMALFSHKELHMKSSQDKIDMMREKGYDWYRDIDFRKQSGGIITRVEKKVEIADEHLKYAKDDELTANRHHWVMVDTPEIHSDNNTFIRQILG